MRGRLWTGAVGIAALVAVVVVPAAMAAYTSPKLEVTQTATGVVLKASLSPDDDPTARVAINVPLGTTLTTNQAPGAVLGRARVVVRTLDTLGIDLPVEGQIVVGAPGQPATGQQACIGSSVPIATWQLTASALGQTLSVPMYLLAQPQTQLGPAFLVICLPSPDAPTGAPGQTQLRVKLYSAELTINGVFGKVSTGTWISSWVPYNPGQVTPNIAGAVVAPAAIAPGSLTIAAKSSGRGATVIGAVTQGGQPRAGATVTVLGGSVKSKLTTRKRIKVSASGRFAAKFAVGTFFRADAVATGGAAPWVCAQLTGSTPCVNPTINGFSAKSKVVRKK